VSLPWRSFVRRFFGEVSSRMSTVAPAAPAPSSSSSSRSHHSSQSKPSGKERYVPGGGSSSSSSSKHKSSSSSNGKHAKPSSSSAASSSSKHHSSKSSSSSGHHHKSGGGKPAPPPSVVPASEAKLHGQKRKKAGEFIRDSIWQVGLPPIPVEMKMLKVPFQADRLLQPASLSLDLYGRMPLPIDPFTAIAADGIDPLTHAKPSRTVALDPRDQRLLADLSQKATGRAVRRKIAKDNVVDGKLPPKLPGSAAPIAPRRSTLAQKKEQEREIENVEEFINVVEESFIDFDDLSFAPEKVGTTIAKVYPVHILNSKQFTSVSFDKKGGSSTNQNSFVYHTVGSSSNSATLFERRDEFAEEATFASLHFLNVAKSGIEGQDKESFIIRDQDSGEAFIGQINYRYNLKAKHKTATMTPLMRKGVDEEMSTIPESVRFVAATTQTQVQHHANDIEMDEEE
jgi:hypothetical protein